MISEDEAQAFAAAFSVLGPFEPAPHIAVALSGGSDSLALLLLLRNWIASCGGRLTALSVDHGLRPEAAAECRQVGEMIATLNAAARVLPTVPQIDHHILAWQGVKPATGLMAAARDARYRLLAAWCRAHDVLHLALAHHADDQAETVLMRAEHGSGAIGLAGMAALRCEDGVRLLRPLLGWRKSQLIAILKRAGLTWIEDPSNRADRFERVRWRRQLEEQGDIAPLLAETEAAGQRRDGLERAAALWLARQGRIDPYGYAELPLAAVLDAATDLRDQILRQVLEMIGGAAFPPAPGGLTALVDRLRPARAKGAGLTATLAGCRLAIRHGRLLIFREAEGCAGPVTVAPGEGLLWDRRFRLRVAADTTVTPELHVAAIGKYGMRGHNVPAALKAVPLAAREALPGLWLAGRLCAVGQLRSSTPGELPADGAFMKGIYKLEVSFCPARGATSCGFTVVTRPRHTM